MPFLFIQINVAAITQWQQSEVKTTKVKLILFPSLPSMAMVLFYSKQMFMQIYVLTGNML